MPDCFMYRNCCPVITESPEQESEDGGEGETGEGSGEAGAETEDGEAGTE